MKNATALILALFSCFNSLEAQLTTRTEGFADVGNANPYTLIEQIPMKPEIETGAFYVNEDWKTGNIHLYSGDTLNKIPTRFNALTQQLEILTDFGIKILDESQVREFFWEKSEIETQRTFINAKELRVDSPIFGLVEILVEGTAKLILQFEREFLESNYNIQIDMGKRSSRETIKQKYYIIDHYHLIKLPPKGKNGWKFFRSHKEKMKDYINENKLQLKKRNDLIWMVNQYNCLLNS